LEVTVSGQVDPSTGMICNLSELDDSVRVGVLDRFDHQNLNMCPEFAHSVPTTENLSEAIFKILKQNFKAAHLDKVRLEETTMNSFEYTGGAELRR
jgi:6-pyruvoyltetrahydropterin/6-carboxytetrahydropterin synthase